MTAKVRCLHCDVWIVAFGGTDIGTVVLDHLHTVHRRTVDTRRHPSGGAA